MCYRCNPVESLFPQTSFLTIDLGLVLPERYRNEPPGFPFLSSYRKNFRGKRSEKKKERYVSDEFRKPVTKSSDSLRFEGRVEIYGDRVRNGLVHGASKSRVRYLLGKRWPRFAVRCKRIYDRGFLHVYPRTDDYKLRKNRKPITRVYA